MPDGTSRLSTKDGKEIFHFMGCSTFAEYAVIAEISAAKVRENHFKGTYLRDMKFCPTCCDNFPGQFFCPSSLYSFTYNSIPNRNFCPPFAPHVVTIFMSQRYVPKCYSMTGREF